ncbi:hypothetical protein V2W45_1471055 [Cenococcum geophilum]
MSAHGALPGKYTFSSLKQLQDYINDESSKIYSLRVFSICQSSSWEPLDVSNKMLSEILKHQCVQEEFIEVIRSFRYREAPTEEAFCGHWSWKTSLNRDEISYTFKYPERRGRPSGEPWSIRQTAVYQGIDHQSKHSCWILLHPKYKSVAGVRLKDALSMDGRAQELVAQPLQQHIMLISAYFANWRDYMEHYEEELLSIVSLNDLNRVEVMGASFCAGLDTLTRVRFIESRLLPLPPIFHSYTETLGNLSYFSTILFTEKNIGSDAKSETACILRNLIRQTASYTRNARLLLVKTTSIAQLLSDVLALKNQHIAMQQSGHLFDLTTTSHAQNESICAMTRASVKDSSTVRVITVVMLVYLPTTFQTLFGTQLLYLTPTHSLAASPQLWVLFAVSVPLTVLTMLYWLVRKRTVEAKRALASTGKESDVETGNGIDSKEEQSGDLPYPQ